MEPERILELLEAVARGAVAPDTALADLAELSYAEVGDVRGTPEARVDHHRALRCGFPEVIFCQGKSADQVGAIGNELLARGDVVLATRADAEHAAALAEVAPDAKWLEVPRLVVVDRRDDATARGLRRGGQRRHRRHTGRRGSRSLR